MPDGGSLPAWMTLPQPGAGAPGTPQAPAMADDIAAIDAALKAPQQPMAPATAEPMPMSGSVSDIDAVLSGKGQIPQPQSGVSPSASHSATPPDPGLLANIGATTSDVVADTLGAITGLPTDLANAIITNPLDPRWKAFRNPLPPQWWRHQFAKVGLGTEALPPPTPAEKEARSITYPMTETLLSALPGEAEINAAAAAGREAAPFAEFVAPGSKAATLGGTAARLGSAAALGATGEIGGQGGAAVAPEGSKLLGYEVGSLIGGAGLYGGGEAALRGAARGVGALRAGIPPTGEAAAEAAGRQAAERFRAAATNPEQAEETLRQQAGEPPLVPGAQETTAEITNDPGLLWMQRQRESQPIVPRSLAGSPGAQPSRVQREVPQMRAAANEARLRMLEGMAPPTATPDAARAVMQAHLDELDRIAGTETGRAQAHAAAEAERAQPRGTADTTAAALSRAIEGGPAAQGLERQRSATAAAFEPLNEALPGREWLGGELERGLIPEQYGEQMRAPQAERARAAFGYASRLYNDIDPEGRWGIAAPESRQAARDLAAEAQTYGHTYSGAENRLISELTEGDEPRSLLWMLGKRIEINALLRTASPPEARRLMILKDAIDRDLLNAAPTEPVETPPTEPILPLEGAPTAANEESAAAMPAAAAAVAEEERKRAEGSASVSAQTEESVYQKAVAATHREVPNAAFNGDVANNLSNIFLSPDFRGDSVPLANVGMLPDEIGALERAGLATDGRMSRAQFDAYEAERSRRLRPRMRQATDKTSETPRAPIPGASVAETKPPEDAVAAGEAPQPKASLSNPLAHPGEPAFPLRPLGESRAFTHTGTSIPVQYAITDIDNLVPSHLDDFHENPAYPQELQPRDRTRAASADQIAEMLRSDRFTPERLGETADAENGAPIVGPEGYVESGNARTMALRRAYAQNLPAAQKYREFLAAQGYPAEGIEHPVLVRLNRAPMSMEDRARFAMEANVPAQAAMSGTEQAIADAKRLPSSVLNLAEGGDLTSAANRRFVRAALDRISTAGERGALMDAEGNLSAAGQRRLEGALLAKAYDDPALVARLTEDPDPNIKAIGGALLDAAPEWGRMRAAVAEGRAHPDADITKNVVEAANLVAHARDQHEKLADALAQRDMFGGGVDPRTEAIVKRWFFDGDRLARRVGRAKMADELTAYADEAQRPMALLDVESRPVLERIERARQKARGAAGDLFGGGGEGLREPGPATPFRAGPRPGGAKTQGNGRAPGGLGTPATGAEESAPGSRGITRDEFAASGRPLSPILDAAEREQIARNHAEIESAVPGTFAEAEPGRPVGRRVSLPAEGTEPLSGPRRLVATNGRVIRIHFPDENHADLYDLGSRLEHGYAPAPGELQRIFDVWNRFVAHDPEAGAPFASPADVPQLARDMVDAVDNEADRAARSGQDWGRVGFHIDPGQLAHYVARFHVPEDRLAPPSAPETEKPSPSPANVSRAPRRLFPSYTTEQLKATLANPHPVNTDPELLDRIADEVRRRESGESKVRVTPQVEGAPRTAPAPAVERTAQGSQLVIPGAEQSAVQAAASREAAGHGRIAPRKPQQEPGALFASQENRQLKLLEQPDFFEHEKAGPERELAPPTPEAIENLRGANRAYFEAKRLYHSHAPGQRPHAVGRMLERRGGEYVLPPERVPWLFVHAGKTQADDVRTYLNAGGDPAALADTFGFSLRSAVDPRGNGEFNLAAYRRWMAQHRDGLAQVPEVLRQFETAAGAKQKLDDIDQRITAFKAEHPLASGEENAKILGRYWKKGDAGRDAIRDYLRVTAATPEAQAAIRDVAALDFGAAAFRDGRINPALAARWLREHGPALAEIPGEAKRFADAAKAQEEVGEIVAQHAERRQEYVKSVAGKFLGDDPDMAMRRVLSGPDRTRKAEQLWRALGGDPAAEEGIRRAIIDEMRMRFEGEPVPGSETGAIRAQRLDDWLEQNEGPLRVFFGPEAKKFDALQESLRRARLVRNAKAPGGSDTAERLLAAGAERPRGAWAKDFVTFLAGEAATRLLGLHGLGGEALPFIGAGIRHAVGAAMEHRRAAFEALRADILDRMLLDPEFALDRLEKFQHAPARTRETIFHRLVGRAVQSAILSVQQQNRWRQPTVANRPRARSG